MGYKSKNQYWVYNQYTRKVYITIDIFVNK